MDYKYIQESIQAFFNKYALQPMDFDHSRAKQLALELGVSIPLIYVLYRVFLYNLYIHPVNRVPGPKIGRIPFMGNFPEVMGSEVGASFKQWSQQYGGIVSFHGQWNRPMIAVTDPNLLKQVLTSQAYDFEKTSRTSNGLRRILGNGVLVAEGEEHKYQRKMLNPAFTVSNIRAMVPLMAKPAFMLRDQWRDAVKDTITELEISSSLSLATLDVIGWAFGQDFKSLEYYGSDKQSRLSRAYLHIFSNEDPKMRLLTFIFPWVRYLPTQRNLKTRQNLKWLDIETRALVQAGIDRALMEKKTGIKRDGPKDLLDIMIDLKDDDTNQKFTVDEIKNQCLTFLAAG
jgi:cytochrome P450